MGGRERFNSSYPSMLCAHPTAPCAAPRDRPDNSPLPIRFPFDHSNICIQEKQTLSLQFTPQREATHTLIIKHLVQNPQVCTLTPYKPVWSFVSQGISPTPWLSHPDCKTDHHQGKIALTKKRILFTYSYTALISEVKAAQNNWC